MGERHYSIEDSERAKRRALRTIEIAGQPESDYEEFVNGVATALDDPSRDRHDVVRDTLASIHGLEPETGDRETGDRETGDRETGDRETGDPVRRLLRHTCDPRNATLEPEYYADIDRERYAPLKPLHWLWIMFDRSPLGRNLHLGVQFRRMLAERLFKSCGRNVKIFHDVEITYGYNLVVGDDVVIHRGVLLDDRAGITLGSHVSISDFANIYSHSHSPTDIGDISLTPTVIGDGARITYHSTVLSGAHMGEDSILGAHGLLRKPLGPHEIAGGVPARFLRHKPKPGQSV